MYTGANTITPNRINDYTAPYYFLGVIISILFYFHFIQFFSKFYFHPQLSIIFTCLAPSFIYTNHHPDIQVYLYILFHINSSSSSISTNYLVITPIHYLSNLSYMHPDLVYFFLFILVITFHFHAVLIICLI